MARKKEIKIGITKKRELAKKYAASHEYKKSWTLFLCQAPCQVRQWNSQRDCRHGEGDYGDAVRLGERVPSPKPKSKPKSAAKKTTAKWVYYYKGKKTTKAKYDEMKKLGRKSAPSARAFAKMALGAKRARAMATEAKAKYKRSPTKYKAECKKFFKNAKPKIATSKKTRKKYVASVWVQFTKKFGVPLAKILLKECKIKLKDYSSEKYTRKGTTFTRKRK